MANLDDYGTHDPNPAASAEVFGSLLLCAEKYGWEQKNRLRAVQHNPQWVSANYEDGLLLARMGRKEEADRQLAHAKTLREEDERSSRLQLRLMEPEEK